MKTIMVLTCLAPVVARVVIRKPPTPSTKRGKSVEAVTIVLNSDQAAFVKSLDLIIAFVLASSTSKPF